MKLLKTQCLKGPNYWSNSRTHLIVLKLDLEQYEYLPSNKITNFSNTLKNLIPSLYEHRCSPGVIGGFFERLETGTWLGHIIEHVALELQCLAGMECGFGRTYGTDDEGIYDVIFSYQYEEAGLYAANAAIKLIETIAIGQIYLDLETDISHLRSIAVKEQFGPSTQSIINEAKNRNIPIHRIDSSLVTLGYGAQQQKIWTSVTSNTNAIGMEIVADKELTKKLLSSHFIAVPRGKIARTLQELFAAQACLDFPLVTKPKIGNHGRGITTNILSEEKLIEGFHLAKNISEEVIVEHFIHGDDYRILVVDYQVVAVAKRVSAHIVGNGKQTISELIDQINADPRRGICHSNFLTQITVDAATLTLIQEQGYSLDTILPLDAIAYLKNTANMSTGGTAQDMTDQIHPKNKHLAERIATLVGLDICGIDIVAKDIRLPITESNGAVLEVNAGPGLRMHLAPNEGTPRNVAKPIIDMLFPNEEQGRIPIVGVSGTNGKTTVVTLLAKLAQKAGHHVGYTTTEGIYIKGQLIHEGDCSGPISAQVVLQTPDINFAVLECARGGILRAGLGFDECAISIITNITGDHLGLNGINTLEQLAQVKAVLARSTQKDGYCILNAEDDLTYFLKNEIFCNIGLFSREKTSRITEHCENGGLAAYLDNGMIVVQWDSFIQKITSINSIPLTYNGTASAMILNILPVVLAGFISKINPEIITEFLIGLKPTPEILPGRMNLFPFNNYRIMIDYAHNEGAFIELQNYLSTISFDKAIGIIGVAGDRRNEDIINIGFLVGQMFDELIIRHDKGGRGRTNQQITELLLKGIHNAGNYNVTVISNEFEAINYAITQAQMNTFIFFTVENILQSTHFIDKLHKTAHSISSEPTQ